MTKTEKTPHKPVPTPSSISDNEQALPESSSSAGKRKIIVPASSTSEYSTSPVAFRSNNSEVESSPDNAPARSVLTSVPAPQTMAFQMPPPRTPLPPESVAAATATARPSVVPMSVEPAFFDDDQIRVYYQHLKNNYEAILQYVQTGRQARLQQQANLQVGAEAVKATLNFIPPIQRAQLEPIIIAQEQEVLAITQNITMLDQQLHTDRNAMIHEIKSAYTLHPDQFQALLADTEWPTPEVCQDLQLSPDIVQFVREALAPTQQKPTTIEENQELSQMRNRISELETILMQQRERKTTLANTSTAKTTSNTPTSIYERRRRTKIPTFSNGDPTAAQHWIEKYIRICGYLEFDEKDRLDELNVALEGPAIKWFSTLHPDHQNNFDQFKAAFLLHFGGGTQPSRNALADLKKLRQNTTPMSKFAPEFTDLLARAEIFSDPLQLDFFCDRIHPKFQEAVYMRGATTLQEAIAICTEVEYNLTRTGLTLQPYSAIPSGTTQLATTTTPQQATTTSDYNTSNQNAQSFRQPHQRNNSYRSNNRRNHNHNKSYKKNNCRVRE